MEGQFKVGEVCIVHSLVKDTDSNGLECVIDFYWTCVPWIFPSGTVFKEPFYCVTYQSGERASIMGRNLRRRPPKQDHYEWAAKKVRDLLLTQPKEVA